MVYPMTQAARKIIRGPEKLGVYSKWIRDDFPNAEVARTLEFRTTDRFRGSDFSRNPVFRPKRPVSLHKQAGGPRARPHDMERGGHEKRPAPKRRPQPWLW
jgi:hypothetical protein